VRWPSRRRALPLEETAFHSFRQRPGRCAFVRAASWLLAIASMGLVPGALAAELEGSPAGAIGLQRDVVFADYSPLSRSMELARRLLSPLHAQRALAQLASTGKTLAEQPVDLGQERFAVYVPNEAPVGGYGLLVFVPPWQNAMLPQRWAATLDRHGMIYVSAANAGNGTSILDRREPLALLAAYNIMRRYPVDPERVYIGGFSGGSRVALRIALAYPDLFHGALLIAGSDPIGDASAPLPAAELFRQFQDSTRLVYLTGISDPVNIENDAASRQSLRRWCVFDVDAQLMPRAGHDLADPDSLHRALQALTNHVRVEPAQLLACRARLESELAAGLRQVADLLANAKSPAARALLQKIDSRYGGLAAPGSLELAEQLEVGR